jgi:hypothetical protein
MAVAGPLGRATTRQRVATAPQFVALLRKGNPSTAVEADISLRKKLGLPFRRRCLASRERSSVTPFAVPKDGISHNSPPSYEKSLMEP